MKVLIVTDVYFPMVGGVPVSIRQLSQELSYHGNEVHILAPSSTVRNVTTKEGAVVVHKIASVTLHKKRGIRLSIDVVRIGQLIKKLQPDIIHIMTPGTTTQTAIIVAKSMGVPVVGTAHVIANNLLTPWHLSKTVEKPMEYFLNKQIIGLFKQLDFVITPSHIAAQFFQKIGFKKPIQAISNGIYLQKFQQQSEKAKEVLRKKLSLPNKQTLLYVGRLDKEKRVDILLKAVAKVQDICDIHTVIVGKGMEASTLSALAKRLKITDKITFVGYLSDDELPTIYQLANIFIMPGDAELQSIATLEAMASGLPIIAADAIALPQLVHNGKNGYLFRPNNPLDLANAIQKLANDKVMQVSMGKKSKDMVAEHDMRFVVKQMQSVYKQLIKNAQKKAEKKDYGFLHKLSRFYRVNS